MSDKEKTREQSEPPIRNPRYEGATPERVALALLRAKSEVPQKAHPQKNADEKRVSED